MTIEFGFRGPYVSLMGGGTTTLQAIWCAARWLADGSADRVLVLAVETMHEVRDLFARVRRLYRAPLVEGAACLALDPGDGGTVSWASAVARRPGTEAAVCATIGAVLGDREPRLVASSAGGALARIEARCLAGRGLGPDRMAALRGGRHPGLRAALRARRGARGRRCEPVAPDGGLARRQVRRAGLAVMSSP